MIVFGVDPAYDEKLAAYVEWERKQDAFAFHRTDYRHTILKRKCDCGCWIDGSEPYRYQVWKINSEPRISQRRDCEFCARSDNAY